MVLMCFFIYNFSSFVPNIIKKRNRLQEKKTIKLYKHTQKHTFFSPVHTNCCFLKDSMLQAHSQREDREGVSEGRKRKKLWLISDLKVNEGT